MTPAARAASLIGTPFRLQGRQAGVALDCVGLVIEAYQPLHLTECRHYGWRRHELALIEEILSRRFVRVEKAQMRASDLLVLKSGRDRCHFGIAAADGLIHADAVVGRVVCRPWPVALPIIGVWRLRHGRS